MVALLFLTALTLNDAGALRDTVDLTEINHFYDDAGKLVFAQVIFYNWSLSTNRYQVVAWRLLKDRNQIPNYNFKTGSYESIWRDGDLLRRVRTKYVRHSWTQFDPEILEREHLPKEYRRELRKLRKAKKLNGNP